MSKLVSISAEMADMTTNKYLLVILSLLCIGLISCGEAEVPGIIEEPSQEPTPTPTPTPTPPPPGSVDTDIPTNAGLYFRLEIKWETSGDKAPFESWAGCELPNSPTPLPDTPTEGVCNITIPEGQLYYSHLNFKVGTRYPQICPIMNFRPYYYVRSEKPLVKDANGNPTDGYLPPGEKDFIECSDGINPKCYGGAGPVMVKGFPDNTGSYFLTEFMQQASYELKSSNSVRHYNSYLVNYQVTNDLALVERANTVTSGLKERVQNTYNDYEVSCTNYWGEKLFSMVIVISDENMDGAESGTPHDNFPDWN